MRKNIIQLYLFFGGRCEEALDFYQTAMPMAKASVPVEQSLQSEGARS